MDNRTSPVPLDEDLYKKLQEGLIKAFDNATNIISCVDNHGTRMMAAQATAKIAEALMRLQDRKPV